MYIQSISFCNNQLPLALLLPFPSPNPISKKDNEIKVGTIPLRLLPVWLLRAQTCICRLRNRAPAVQVRASILGSPGTRQPKLEEGPQVWRNYLCSSQINHLAPQDSKSPWTQYEGENKPSAPCLHACTVAGRWSLSRLRLPRHAGWGPGERLTCINLPCFCWESRETEVALLRCTCTRGTCCFNQCRGMQWVPPRAQGSSICNRGAGHPCPMQPPLPSSGTCSKVKAQPGYFTFLSEKKSNKHITTTNCLTWMNGTGKPCINNISAMLLACREEASSLLRRDPH